MITIRVTPSTCTVESRVESWLGAALRELCAYEAPGAHFSPLMNKRNQKGEKIWDGKISVYDRQARTFPTGLLPRVLAFLEAEGVLAKVEEFNGPRLVEHEFKLLPAWQIRDYQQESVAECLRLRRCMVKVATGGGKTVIAGGIVEAVGYRTIFLVHTRDLLLQAIDMFSDMFGAEHVGQIGDGKVDPGPLTVATVQTMARICGSKFSRGDEDDLWKDEHTKVSAKDKVRLRQFFDGVGLVFMDECHRVASDTAEGVVRAIQYAQFRIGLSASPWRDDGADIVLEGVFGQVGPEVSASRLIELGYLVRPVVRMLKVPPEIYDRKTPYDTIYNDYIVENDARNAMGVRAAASMVRRGRATLVLVRRLAHGEDIAGRLTALLGYGVPFLSGKDDSLLRRDVLDDIRSDRLGCVVASTIADEGLDVKPLSGLVLLGGGKSSTRALQRIGRVLRPYRGKKNSEVVDFNDQALHLITHSMAREKMYATEPEFMLLDV